MKRLVWRDSARFSHSLPLNERKIELSLDLYSSGSTTTIICA
jgi:hypothetical protein